MSAVPNPLLFLITGSRGAGKTTFCRAMVQSAREAGWQVAGLLSNPIFTGSTRTSIIAEDLHGGERRILATRSDQPTPGSRVWQFDPSAVTWSNQVLQLATPCDLLVVDELGPIEFEQGQGWQLGLTAVDSKQYAIALVVIRTELLGEALIRWGEANLVEIDTPEDSTWKAQKLSKQLF